MKKYKILVVDDEPDARFLLSEILGEGHEVVAVENVEMALEKLESEKPDIVLTDIKMPGENGISLLVKIKKIRTDIPVLLLTGHGDKQMAIDAVRNGAFDFLEKPFEDEEILSAVSRAISILDLKRRLHETQARSLQSEKMATLGMMAGGIAHEINTPLNTILLQASTIRGEAEKKTPNKEALIRMAQDISGVVTRISKIIKSLQAFSRGKTNDPFLDTKVIHIIEHVTNLCSKRFVEEGVELAVDQVSAEHLMIQCRESEIAQVIFNLINNSKDAVEKLQEKWVRLETRDVGDSLQIIVKDSGPGIPKNIRERIFQPFFTTKEVGRGTGLGLSVSIGIIESHHGKLTLDEYDAHTTFIIQLPKIQKIRQDLAG